MKKMKAKTGFLLLLFMAAGVVSAQNAKYEIKSAIIKKVSTVMGQKVESTVYIDDYGQKEMSETVMNAGGTEKHILTIMNGDSLVTVDMDMKTAQIVKLPQKPVNYLKISDEDKEMYKLQELGEENVLDKSCKKYSLEVNQGGQTAQVTTWVWKGIPLKSETSVGGMNMTEEVTEIQEGAEVPADKFVVPEGITLNK